MNVLRSSLLNPVIKDAEVEFPLRRLDQFPGDRSQNRIQVRVRKLEQNGIGLFSRAGSRIAKLTAKNQERLAIQDELRGIPSALQVRYFLCTAPETREQHESQKRHSCSGHFSHDGARL